MLQWMGGSRRKVTASRKSTQKRQKQYFEQRKRQQQNVQMMGSDNRTESSGVGGEILKEHMSLDILNLLNLSKTAQECNSFCQKGKGKGKDDGDYFSGMPGSVSTNQPKISTKVETTVNACGFEEEKAGAPLCCQGQPSPKKVSLSAPNHQSTTFDGPPSHCKTVTDQYSELSVIDLLCDDELNPTVEKSPTCEDHVSFSLEGLGKVGTKTPVHSPQQWARIPCRNSSSLKDGRKTKYRNLSHLLDDIEHEVDTMMQDIGVSPISSSFPSNKLKHSSVVIEDHKPFYDNNDKNGSSISEEFFPETENNEDTWNACSLFLDEKFDIGMGYDTSYKKAFQMDCKSPELLKRGANKMECYDFEDLLPVKWPSATVRKDINMGEPLASFSTDQLEDDFNFCGSGRTRLYGNFDAPNLIPEDVRDSSSLLSEESSSSTVVRGDFIVHSPSRLVTGENRRKHRNVFASPRHKYNNNEEKNRSRSNPSKQKPSYYSNSFLQEEMGAQNSRKFEERYASVDRSSLTTSFYQDLEANFSFSGCKNSAEDPFSVNTTPEYKASPSFGGFKNAATLADSPPCSFTSEKFAFDCLTAFPSFPSWPTGPCLSPDFQFKEGPQDCVGFHCETSSTDMSVQGSVNKEERQMKLQKDRHNYFEQEGIFMGDNELSSEKKMAVDAPTSNNHEQESEGTEDTNPKTTECHETADSPVLVEEISSPLKIPDKHESQVDNRKSNSDAETETPLKCKIANKEMEICPPEGRNRVNGKHKNDQIGLSGQVMYESYVFHMRVQKVLNGACTISRRNNSFLKPGSNRITHQI